MKELLTKVWHERLNNKYSAIALGVVGFYLYYRVDVDAAIRDYIRSPAFGDALKAAGAGVVAWLFLKKGGGNA